MPKQHDVGAGYSTLSANLIRFSELNQLPISIDLSRLDEGMALKPLSWSMEPVA